MAIGRSATDWELGFKQCSLHHIMQVLRVCDFCAFSSPPAFPPCCCPLVFQHQVRRLTYRISSESYPGDQECVVSCHGAPNTLPHLGCSAGQWQRNAWKADYMSRSRMVG